MSIDWDAVGAVAQAAAALGAGGALIYAALQLRMGQAAGASQAEEAEKTRRTEEQARQVERAIAAHRDLTTGEVGAARDRLTTLLWQEGEATYSRNVCWRPYFQELLPPRGRLGLYHADVLGNDESEPMRDLFNLWCFERIDAARVGEALDQDMLFRLIAHHAVWWDELLQNIGSKPMFDPVARPRRRLGHRTRFKAAARGLPSDMAAASRAEAPGIRGGSEWAVLGSNQRPPACKADPGCDHLFRHRPFGATAAGARGGGVAVARHSSAGA